MNSRIELNDHFLVIRVKDRKPVVIDRKLFAENKLDNNFSPTIAIDFAYIIGVYQVEKVWFIVAAKEVTKLCSEYDIYSINSFEIIQVTPGNNHDARKLVERGLYLSSLFFSTSLDLSNTLIGRFRHEQPRESFIWNSSSIRSFSQMFPSYENIIQPVIAGFMRAYTIRDIVYLLISRRSSIRAGTRFWMRGADDEGNVANFVETEQIIRFENNELSFVQIRGSIPLGWSQYPDLTRLPSLRLLDSVTNEKRLTAHFDKLYKEYGDIIAVSLTDIGGREKEITQTYNALGSRAPHVRFQYFDFHKECSKMRYGNISKLVAQIQDGIDTMGWTHIQGGNLIKKQIGVIRTNCIDCLDRTNVVQSTFAKIILEKQLQSINVSINHDDLKIRSAWTDNANAISIQYAGTPALKTDFTRTGKRTKMGALSDGKNAIVRYYMNTCVDGSRQDSYDIITGAAKAQSIKKNGFIVSVLMSIIMILSAIFLMITGKKRFAKKKMLEARMQLVNTPRFREINFSEEPIE